MSRETDTIVLIDGAHHGIDRLVEFALIVDLSPVIVLSVEPMECRMAAAIDSIKLLKEFRVIEQHPRYQDRTPRSPKPRFRKGR